MESEEDDDGGESKTDVQPSRQGVVVLHPPASPAVADELVEDESDEPPREIVQRGSRRDEAGAAEDDGRGEVADGGTREHARAEVNSNGESGAGEPEPHQRRVHLTRGVDSLGADDAPDDGGVEEHASVGAHEVVGLMLGADVLDGAEGPVHDANLDNGRPEAGDHLGHECDSGRDAHVVACFGGGG